MNFLSVHMGPEVAYIASFGVLGQDPKCTDRKGVKNAKRSIMGGSPPPNNAFFLCFVGTLGNLSARVSRQPCQFVPTKYMKYQQTIKKRKEMRRLLSSLAPLTRIFINMFNVSVM